MERQFAEELDAWLTQARNSPESDSTHDEPYIVERTIKSTQTGRTEVVRNQRGLGPFIQKTFVGDTIRGGAYERLLEAQIAGKHLKHVPYVYDYKQINGNLQVICEYVQGRSVRELASQEEVGIPLLKQVYAGLCDAVEEIHTSLDTPMIHRDIKPSNVIVGADGVKLIDFGIARDFDPEATRDTVRYGTPGYAPPEQFGYGQTSTASDIYALGMTLAFCLTGEDPTPKLREKGFDDPRIPKALRPVLMEATAFNPAERYATAHDLHQDLDRALGKTPPLPNHRELNRASTLLGRIWNAVVIGFWGIIMWASVTAIMYPTPENARYPFWFLIFEYVGFVMVPGSGIALALLDKRRLRARIPLPVLSIPRTIIYTLAFVFVCWAFSMLVYLIAVSPYM